MKLKRDKVKAYLSSRGWSDVLFAKKLGLDYSYVYRVLRGDRGIGKKFISGFLLLCEKEGLDYRDFISLDGKD